MQILALIILQLGLAAANPGCYSNGSPCNCEVQERCCGGDYPGFWYTGSNACNDCEDSSTDAADAGCYIHSQGGYQPALTRTGCMAASGTWMDSGCSACNTTDTADCVASPPSPPAAPAVAPSDCEPQKGEDLPTKTTAAMADPVNEPCYSHATCRLYGHPNHNGYVCCMAIGTCDNLVSNSAKYYEGGCRGVNYANNASHIVAAAAGQLHPSTDEGCVKQGECSIPFTEQAMHWTTVGSGMTFNNPSDATMTRLLAGATEAHEGACLELYPLRETVPTAAQVSMQLISPGSVSDFDAEKRGAVATTIAAKLRVPRANVRVTVATGSVVLTITVLYPTMQAATAARVTMVAAMDSPAAAASFVSSPTNVVAISSISAPPAATMQSAEEAAGGSSEGLSTGAIAGIAAGSAAAVVVVAIVLIATRKKPNTKAATYN